jgi:hypothetical protein
VDDFIFVLIVVGGFLYLGVFLWALTEAERRDRNGWLVSLLLFGPVALVAWIAYGRRQA